MTEKRHRGWIIGLLAALTSVAVASPLQLPSLGVQLELPDGWAVTKTVPGQGVTLSPPGGGAALDVIVWSPVADKLSASAAAQAHEDVLATRLTYTRQTATAV